MLALFGTSRAALFWRLTQGGELLVGQLAVHVTGVAAAARELRHLLHCAPDCLNEVLAARDGSADVESGVGK